MKFKCEQCSAQYAIADEKVGKKGVRVRCKKCGHIITVRPSGEEVHPSLESSPPPEVSAPPPAASQPPQEEQSPAAQAPADSGSQPVAPEQGRDTTDVGPPPDGAAAPKSGFDPGEDELGNALDNILGESGLEGGAEGESSEERPEIDRQSTRLFNVEEMQRVQAEKESATREEEERGQIGDIFRAARASEAQDKRVAAPAAPSEADRERVEWYVAVNEQQVGPMSIAELGERFGRGEFDAESLVWKSGFDDWVPIFEVGELKFIIQTREPAAASSGTESPEAQEPEANASTGAEEPERDQDQYQYKDQAFDDGAESASASSTAFGADVDWKPSAVSALSSLAQEELAGLRPQEPEPPPATASEAVGDLPFSTSPDEGVEASPMAEGDSSIIAQIRAEEEALAKRAEEKRIEEEKAAAVAVVAAKKKEEETLAAQEAARREQYQEQREKVVPIPEPRRSTVPGWLIGVISGGGVLIIFLLGFIAYKLATGTSEQPAVKQPVPMGPATNATPQPSPGLQPAASTGQAAIVQPGGTGVQTPPPSTPAAAANGATPPAVAQPAAGIQQPAPAANVSPPTPAVKPETPTGVHKPPVVAKNPKIRTPPAENPKEKVAAREPLLTEHEAKPPPEEKPKHPGGKKPKAGLLDYDDEDDNALAKEMGTPKPAAAAPSTTPPPEVKKELPPLSQADILGVMKQHLAEFQACSKKQKDVDASVNGRMVVEFTVNPEGGVSKVATTTPEFKGTLVSDCISKVISNLRFPKFGGEPKRVPFPFTVK